MADQPRNEMSPQRQEVDDLLNYCRPTIGELNEGKLLAPALIGRPCNSVEDEWELRDKMTKMLCDTLRRLRAQYGVKASVTSSAIKHLAAMKKDHATNKKDLKRISSIWGLHVCNLSTSEMATACGVVERSIQILLREGREQILEAVMQQAAQRAGQSAAGPSIPDPVAGVTGTPDEPEVTWSVPTTVYQRIDQRNTTVYALAGTVAEANPQTTQQNPQRPRRNYREQLVVFGCALISLAIGNQLLETLPHVSTGMLLVAGWRVVINCWKLVRDWRHQEPDQHDYFHLRLYRVSYALCWAAFCAVAGAILVNVHGPVLIPHFNFDRLKWAITLIGAVGGMLFMGALDGLDWARGRIDPRWPFPKLQPYAENTWNYRWELLGCGWLIILASLMLQIGPYLSLD